MPFSGYRSTKLYTSILILTVYTYFTFAQEAIVHPQNWAFRLDNDRSNNKRSPNHDQNTDDEFHVASQNVESGIEADDFVDDGNSTRTYVLPQPRQRHSSFGSLRITELIANFSKART